MADTPYIDNSVIGFDPHSNLKFQVDTYNRLSPILNLQDQPAFSGKEPSLLRDNFATPDTIQKRQPLPDISIEDAISSHDPAIQNIGRNSMEEWMNKNIPEYNLGLGRTVETPYDQGKKFLNKKFGFSALRDNEDFYYKNDYMDSSWFGRNIVKNPLRFMGRLIGGTIAKVGESLGYMGSMITSIGDGNYFEKVADNGFSKWFEKQEDNLKENLIPVYKQAGFDDKGFFSKLGDWSFWNDDVVDAAAFMASALVQTLATDGLGNAAGLGKIGSLEINTTSKLGKFGLGKFGKGVDGTIKFLTGADNVAGVANHAFNTASESFFESAGVFKETKQDLLDARKRGENTYTDGDIDKIASQRAASDFKGNLMALTLSNAFENKYIFQPFKRFVKGSAEGAEGILGRVRTTMNGVTSDVETSLAAEAKKFSYSTKAGKFFDWKNPQGRLRFYGGRALASTFVEGLYEENIQLAMERMARYGDYEKKNTIQSILGTLGTSAHQAQEAFKGNDKEASMSIGLGGLIGILGTGSVSKLFGGRRLFQGERSAEIERAEQAIDNYNNLRKQFLSAGDIYKKDDKGNFERDDEGNLVYDEVKIQARAQGLSDVLKKSVIADQLQNPVARKILQDDILSDFVHASVAAGLETSLLDKIRGLHTKSISEITALGFNPSEVKITPDQLAQDVENLIDMHKKAFASTTIRPQGVSSKDYTATEDLRRVYLYKAMALSQAAKNAYLTYDSFLTEQAASRPLSSDNDSAANEHNSLSFQLAGLQQFEKLSNQNGGFFSDHTKARKAEIEKRQKEIKESLQDKIDDNELVEKDNLLLSPRQARSYDSNSIDLSVQQQHATAKNAQLQWDYVADKLSSLNDGQNNFAKYKAYNESLSNKDERADEQPHTVKKNTDGTFTVVSPDGKETPKSYATEEEATKAAEAADNVFEEGGTAEEATPQEVKQQEAAQKEERGVSEDEDNINLGVDSSDNKPPIDLSVDYVPNEIDPDKPVTFWNPNITSKRDTIDISPEEEKLSTDDYSLMRGELIKTFIDGNSSFSNNYRLFIVKDNYPEVYQKQSGTPIVKQEDDKWVFIDPNVIGEVVVLQHKDGTTAKVGDFFKDSYKDMADLPVVFSFDQDVFFGPLYNAQRLPIKAEKAKMTIQEADEENRRWRKEADDARAQVRTGKKDKVEAKLYLSTSGINPKTKTTTVQKRFGDFKFEIATPIAAGEKSTQFGTSYYPGTIVIKIGNADFPAFTGKISEYPEIYSKVQAALSHKFATLEEAQAIRNDFLDVMVNTNDNQFFTIEKDKNSGLFSINFRKARQSDLDKNLPKEEIKRNGIISNPLVGDTYLNVSSSALKSGYRDFNDNGVSEFVSKEDYMALIKPKIMTNLKKVTDREGNLYMETVNPYFSFLVAEEQDVNKIRKNNYDALKNRIIARISSGQADMELIMKGLVSELEKTNITTEQFNQLKTLAETYTPPSEGKVADFYEQQKALLDKKVITQTVYDLSIKIRLKNHPEEEEQYKKSLGEPAIESKKEEPKKEEKKSIADKYKKQEVKSVGEVMREEGDKTTSYVVQDKYVYSPGDNRFSYATSGRKVPDNHLPGILKQMAEKYPYKETAAGNEGFGVFTEENITIYRPPTSLSSPEIVVIDGKISSVEEARKQVAGKTNLEEFLRKYCK